MKGSAQAVKWGAAMLAVSFGVPAFASSITAVVRMQEKISIESLAAQVQNPLSAHYGKPFTPKEIKELSGPSDQDYNTTISELRADGFTILAQSPTHLWVTIKADSKVYETTFGTRIQSMGRGLRRHMTQASIPTRLSGIAAVHGLDNTRRAFPKMVKSNNSQGRLASGPDSGVPQATIKASYGLNDIYAAGITGAGQSIAIATYDNFSIDDVNAFYKLSNLNPLPTVDQVNFNGTAQDNEGSQMETDLDAEFSGMIAPGAAIHVFTSAENSDAGELSMFTAILDDNRAQIVNYSWGSCETTLTHDHQAEMAKVFARAVAQGVNVMVASGDSGSDSCQDGTTAADWPAANPNVVAVGGTSFAQDHGLVAELAWNGSGGGISNLWDLPVYQTGFTAPYLKRSYPDVSFNADPSTGQAVYITSGGTPTWMIIGGTSMAAPQWSGFMALVGQARAKAGKAVLGFLPPIIYGFSPADKATMFNDVTSGNNGAYSAGAGWDAVTGWGSMKGQALLTRLQNN